MNEVTDRITAYLAGGGLFNPELAKHDTVRDLLIDCRAALAPADSVLEDAALSPAEADLLEKAISDFDECGETDVPDAALRLFAAAGYLECVHYHVMPTAQDAIDAARKQGANHD